MRRYVLIGAVLFVVFLVVFAPAGLVGMLLERIHGVALLNPSGTLWRGSGDLSVAYQPAGRASWRFRPVTILQGSLGYRVRLTGPDQDLEADVGLAPNRLDLSARGTLTAAYLNRWLASYDIGLTGDFQLDEVAIEVPTGRSGGGGIPPGLAEGTASGSITWSGGDVRYRLSGQSYGGALPPLVASLGEGLEAYVYPKAGQTPLIRAQLMNNGFVKIGMTRLLTRLLNNPWPGSDGDHEVVLEVEEQLF